MSLDGLEYFGIGVYSVTALRLVKSCLIPRSDWKEESLRFVRDKRKNLPRNCSTYVTPC